MRVTISVEEELRTTLYSHVRPIAEGGMGEVHEVLHRGLRERRVMKILKAGAGDDLGKRLIAEARSLSGLQHRNVVLVLDIGETDSGRPFIVTELLIGQTLRDEVVARGPLPWAEVIEIALDILAGLDAAHRRGVVHRDVKPLNLFYLVPDENGIRVVKILDFGIAKAVSAEAEARAGSALVATQTGHFGGTPAYISPEQATGLRVDARSDIYAVGAVLFYLLTGRPPFRGDSMLDLLTAHLSEIPSAPSKLVAGIPSELDAIVLRALEKQPDARFASAAIMRQALDAVARPKRGAETDIRARPAMQVGSTAELDTTPHIPTPLKPSRARMGTELMADPGGNTPSRSLVAAPQGPAVTTAPLPGLPAQERTWPTPQNQAPAQIAPPAQTPAKNMVGRATVVGSPNDGRRRKSAAGATKWRRPIVIAGIVIVVFALGWLAARLLSQGEAAALPRFGEPSYAREAGERC